MRRRRPPRMAAEAVRPVRRGADGAAPVLPDRLGDEHDFDEGLSTSTQAPTARICTAAAAASAGRCRGRCAARARAPWSRRRRRASRATFQTVGRVDASTRVVWGAEALAVLGDARADRQRTSAPRSFREPADPHEAWGSARRSAATAPTVVAALGTRRAPLRWRARPPTTPPSIGVRPELAILPTRRRRGRPPHNAPPAPPAPSRAAATPPRRAPYAAGLPAAADAPPPIPPAAPGVRSVGRQLTVGGGGSQNLAEVLADLRWRAAPVLPDGRGRGTPTTTPEDERLALDHRQRHLVVHGLALATRPRAASIGRWQVQVRVGMVGGRPRRWRRPRDGRTGSRWASGVCRRAASMSITAGRRESRRRRRRCAACRAAADCANGGAQFTGDGGPATSSSSIGHRRRRRELR